MSILEQAAQLAAAFTNSGLYQDYLRHRAALRNNPALHAQVQAYKKAQAAFESARPGNDGDFDEEKRISHLYAELSLHEVAGPYLTCENALLDIYRQVLDLLYIDIDL